MVATSSVDAVCATCNAPTTALAWLARTRPDLVRCNRHRPDMSAGVEVGAGEVFRRTIPADVREATLQQISDESLRAALTRWAGEPHLPDGGAGRAYVLLGPAGTGKTSAIWAAFAQAVTAGTLRSSDILAGTERAMMEPMGVQSKFTGREDSWGRRLSSQKVVFVDDVGYAQFVDSGARYATWKDLLDRVCARNLTLFMSTNLPGPDALAESLSTAVASRLMRLTGGKLWTAGDVDRRTGHAYRRTVGQR